MENGRVAMPNSRAKLLKSSIDGSRRKWSLNIENDSVHPVNEDIHLSCISININDR